MQITEIRKDLKFTRELVQLMDTLKNIAGSHYHMMEKKKKRFDRFMNAFAKFFRVIDLAGVDDPLVRVVSPRLGMVLVTSDSGFMGGLNQSVYRAATAAIRKHEGETTFIVIGEKGHLMTQDQPVPTVCFPGIHQDTIYEQSLAIKDYLVKEVLEHRLGKVMIAYPRAQSFTAQVVDVVAVLPCGELFDRAAESEVSRRAAQEVEEGRRARLVAESRKVIVESEYRDMVEYLSGVWVTSKLFEVFEDSKLAEFSARAMHLEGSLQKAEKEEKKIRRKMFKASHERIDKGMRESFSAKKKKPRGKRAEATAT